MSYDVAIVGLGTAGALAAALCARKGLRVVALDRQPRAQAGAQWVNGVPEWVFDETDLARPFGAELRGGEHPFHMVAGWDSGCRVTIEHTGVLEVDMRHFLHRVQAEAENHGAELRDQTRVLGFDGQRLQTEQGPVQARWYVDAAGIGGFRGQKGGAPPTALCTAAQYVCELGDHGAAQDFLRKHRAKEGAAICFTGIAGGYSILNVRIEGDRVSLLTGSIPAWGHASGRRILKDFTQRHAFVGPVRFGGLRAIPLAGPSVCIAEDRVARIGDSAGQVQAVHGSGIAQQMLAAKVMAEAFAEGEGPQGYNLRWQRKHGGYLTWSAAFCRFSQSLGPGELARLVNTGTLHAKIMGDVLRQRPPRPNPRALLKSVRGLAQASGVRGRLVGVVARQPVLAAHYARYPEGEAERAKWAQMTRRIAGATPGGRG